MKARILTIPVSYQDEPAKFFFQLDKYSHNGNLAVKALVSNFEYWEPWSLITSNLMISLPSHLAYGDSNHSQEILNYLESEGLIKNLHNPTKSGFLCYEIYDFSRLMELVKNPENEEFDKYPICDIKEKLILW